MPSFWLQCCSLLQGTSSSNQIMNTSCNWENPWKSTPFQLCISSTWQTEYCDWDVEVCLQCCCLSYKTPSSYHCHHSPSVCHWLMMSSMCYKNQCCASYKHEALKLSVQCAMTLATWVLSWAIHSGVASQQHSAEIVEDMVTSSLVLILSPFYCPFRTSILFYCSFIPH